MGYGFIELSTTSPSKVGQSKNFTKKTVNGLMDTNASVTALAVCRYVCICVHMCAYSSSAYR